jgi:hypothetical protein
VSVCVCVCAFILALLTPPMWPTAAHPSVHAPWQTHPWPLRPSGSCCVVCQCAGVCVCECECECVCVCVCIHPRLAHAPHVADSGTPFRSRPLQTHPWPSRPSGSCCVVCQCACVCVCERECDCDSVCVCAFILALLTPPMWPTAAHPSVHAPYDPSPVIPFRSRPSLHALMPPHAMHTHLHALDSRAPHAPSILHLINC